MHLEIITRHPGVPSRRPPLVFVHGICVGAWVWDEHLLPFFADAGYDAHAVSLRGHGGSEGRDRLAAWTLGDYADDLAEAVHRLGGEAVVIGHSLGGAVVQRFIRAGGRAAGVGLLASVPPWGLMPSAWRMGLFAPTLFREVLTLATAGPRYVNPAIMKAGLCSDDLPDETYRRLMAGVGGESPVAGAELQGWPPFAPAPWRMPRCFVLGGEDDRFVPRDEVWRTALYYGVEPVLVPRLAHALMLEPRWRDAAEALRTWLDAAV